MVSGVPPRFSRMTATEPSDIGFDHTSVSPSSRSLWPGSPDQSWSTARTSRLVSISSAVDSSGTIAAELDRLGGRRTW